MRVLFVSNNMPPQGCGVSLWGKLQVEALREKGVDVTYWESWPPVYLPDNAQDFDVVYLNWHCLTLGHVQGQHLPKGPLTCAYIHEAHPTWWENNAFPDIWHHLDVRLTEEEIPGQDVFPFLLPIPNYRPVSQPDWDGPILIGHSGLRGDGLDRIGPACEKNGWELTTSKTAGRWLTMEEEIERLAKCHVICVQNHGAYAGQASAASTVMAAGRPVVMNSGRMLRHIHKINDEEYGGSQFYRIEDVEEGVERVLADIDAGREKLPSKISQDYSWKSQTRKLLKIWEERL